MITQTIQHNLATVRRRIDEACRRSGRNPDSVTLVAVTKYAEMEWVRQLIGLGVTEMGENRPQQLIQRAGLIAEPVAWHLIGNLQRNKVRSILPRVCLIHSVDSVRLLESIERIAGELDLRPRVLLEVHLSGEAAKQGFDVAELRTAWDQIRQLERTQVIGLMTMAAYSENPENARPVFSRLRELRDELRLRCTGSFAVQFQHLSMGMTGDFEVAIEEGATLVRIGSALWDGLAATSESPPGSDVPKASGEAAKQGFDVAELRTAWDHIQQLERIQVAGLMTMAAYSENPEDARPVFARLRELRDELRARGTGSRADQFEQLSMGMTGDFEVAIEEGATLVRIGSALWEGLEATSERAPENDAPKTSGEAAPNTTPLTKGG